MTLPERVQADYETMNLTTGPHPMKLLRADLPKVWRASDSRRRNMEEPSRLAGM